MIIRPYEKGDELRLRPNRFSAVEDVTFVFDLPEARVWSITAGERIVCILVAYMEDGGGGFPGFALLCEDATTKEILNVRRQIRRLNEAHGPFMTLTRPSDHLDRWHRFLGFQRNGVWTDESGTFDRWIMPKTSKVGAP